MRARRAAWSSTFLNPRRIPCRASRVLFHPAHRSLLLVAGVALRREWGDDHPCAVVAQDEFQSTDGAPIKHAGARHFVTGCRQFAAIGVLHGGQCHGMRGPRS